MHRVLKPNGKMIFLVRNFYSFEWFWLLFRGKVETQGHQAAMGLNNWLELFEKHGIRVDISFSDQYYMQHVYKFIGYDFIQFLPIKYLKIFN